MVLELCFCLLTSSHLPKPALPGHLYSICLKAGEVTDQVFSPASGLSQLSPPWQRLSAMMKNSLFLSFFFCLWLMLLKGAVKVQ